MAARVETILMVASMLIGLGLLPFATYQPPDIIFLGAAASLLGSLGFAPAPLMAYLAERELQQSAEVAPRSVTAPSQPQSSEAS